VNDLEGYRKGAPLTLGELRRMANEEVVWVVYHDFSDGIGEPKLDLPMTVEAADDDVSWLLNAGSMGAEFAQEGEDEDECFDEQMGEGEMRLYHAVKALAAARIYKYEVKPSPGANPKTLVDMPVGAKVLKAASQIAGGESRLFLWALVDPEAEKELRAFEVYPTGLAEVKDPDELVYIDTVFMRDGMLVFHVFERDPEAE
jgi:hypothetical protein